MARFARAADNEPLMKLERPTLASSQTTAHLINTCFSDVLSAKPHDPKAVNNLAVSRRGESDYHDTFVDQLKEVSDTYTQRLNLLSQLERHLVQARAKALTDDEKAIASLSESCTTYNDLNLPRGPSQFRKHLDEELLARHHLLTPSQYVYSQPEHRKPPQESPPSYLKATYTATQHASRPSNVDTTSMATKRHQKPIWQSTLSPMERETEKAGLSKLSQKANYLRNSRYSKSKWTNTASSGPVKIRQREQGGVVADQGDSLTSFVAEPSFVEFTDYRVGSTYEASFELKNTSSAIRQLRIVPLASSYFQVTPCLSADGLVAPGLSVSFTVTFTPDSLANYEEEFKIVTCNDESIVIPLRGFRLSPVLNLPAVLEAGYCLAGCSKRCTVECINTGGEGNFKLDQLETSDHQKEEANLVSDLKLGPFTLSPREFYLPANRGSVDINVSFIPDRGVGEYTEEFNMACDNGQVLSFSIRGVAQKVDVGCVFAGVGINSDNAQPFSNRLAIDEDDPVIMNTDGQRDRVIPTPNLNFDPVNPHNDSTGVVIIKNFSNVELSYHWAFYRPITEPPLWKTDREDVPLVSKLVLSDHTPFSVDPSVGTLLARETKSLIFKFTPKQVGRFIDMAHLVLSGIHSEEGLDPGRENTRWLRLSQSEVAVLCVDLCGTSLDYNLDIHPPALLLAHGLPIATETKEQIKLSNHSLASVCYQWDKFDCETVFITVDPPHGHIAQGEEIECAVVIKSKNRGHFSTDLCCRLENCDKAVSLHVSGHVEGPVVSVSCPCLDFGLLPVGRKGSLSFRVTSQSNCSLQYTVRQVVEGDRDGYIDTECLTFDPSHGELSPRSSTTVAVDCISLEAIGRLRTVIELVVDGDPETVKHFWAFADFQRPQVTLDPCMIHMDNCYIGIEATHKVSLQNSSLVATQFRWSSRVSGEDCDSVRVCVTPMTGRIGARETVDVSIGAVWNKMGAHSAAVLRCEVLEMEPPLYLCLSAQVSGLSVSYSVRPTSAMANHGSNKTLDDDLCLDFGSGNKLGDPVSLTVTVTNTSGIPASLEAGVTHFPAATPPTPPSLPKPDGGSSAGRGRFLLNRTANLADKNNKSTQQATSDYSSTLLRGELGCCFVVGPPSLPLPPFKPVTVTLIAYSDMWGMYTDQLICKVPGVRDTVIPIHYGAVGCPIVFQSTATIGYTLTRIGSHAPGSRPVKRVLKLKNLSPVAIRVDWDMFNLIQNDNKYVDLIMSIGEPFPKVPGLLHSLPKDNTHLKPVDPAVSEPRSDYLGSRLVSKSESSLLLTARHVREEGLTSHSESRLEEDLIEERDDLMDVPDCDLITALIVPHEGIRSSHPFDIHPKQITIPGHGLSSVEITFSPSIEALTDMGHNLASYALGHISLDGAPPPNVTRPSGYDVDPLRIDILAGIEHARLSLQCDEDDGLVFTYPASVLLEDGSTEPLETQTLTHHLTLVNPTSSVVEFQLCTLSKHFKVTNISLKKDPQLLFQEAETYIKLKPQKSVGFNVSFTLSLDNVRDANDGYSCSFTDSLQINFSTGAVQTFPLSAIISPPILTLSTQTVDFGTTHIGSRPSSASVLVSNMSMSNAVWRLEVSSDLRDIVSVQPDCGYLPLHMAGGKPSTSLIKMEFAPSREYSYSGFIYLTEGITCSELTLKISGQGSADEKFIVGY